MNQNPHVEIPADAEPGFSQYHARTAIRDLVRLLGFENAREYVLLVLDDEGGAKKWATINHERH